MRLSNLLILNALVVFAFGVIALFAPGPFFLLYGITLSLPAQTVAQILGAAGIGFAVLNWAARSVTDPAAVRAITLGNLAAHFFGLIVSLTAQANGYVNGLGWSTVAIFLLFTLGFGIAYLTRPETS